VILLTAGEFGTDEPLFDGGDPVVAAHTTLTVRSIAEESRIVCDEIGIAPMNIGFASGNGVLPSRKSGASELSRV
jgi:hypothetical protein